MGEVSLVTPGPHCTSCCPDSAGSPIWLCDPSSSGQVCLALQTTPEGHWGHWDKLPTPPLGTLETGWGGDLFLEDFLPSSPMDCPLPLCLAPAFAERWLGTLPS